ncbi:PDZ domain-containing protein [uncultured Bacteroides sp.]|uniref:PDZ domain-containing protein n=1 Tax=uncultured Bacteroides sp. TaxID=162156 RepID=UPI0026191A69|nr:PDZ domain-containing protein [uncultured Bacteroides sp.]
MKRKKKIILSISAIILAIIIALGIYFYPFGRYLLHQIEISEALPENMYSEIPFKYGRDNHFQIDCRINKDHHVTLSIDTKATCLMRTDSILKYGGQFWGELPIKWSNAYNVKYDSNIYSFQSIRFGEMEVTTPLFMETCKDNLIYDVVADGVFGVDLLKMGCWKFDTEAKKIKLFHCKNQAIIDKETEGLVKISNGLEDDSISIHIGNIPNDFHFTLDLGYSGAIEINNKTTDLLKQKYEHQQINILRKDGMKDTITIFENIPISIAGIKIDSCQLVNMRSIDGNYIGAKFMQNFNFLLMYERKEHNPKHLYLQKRSGDAKGYRQNTISKFGLNLEAMDGKTVVTSLLKDGAAEKAGVRFGDEILQIEGMTKEQLTSGDISRNFQQDVDSLEQLKITIKDKGINNTSTQLETNENPKKVHSNYCIMMYRKVSV